jgi:Pectate lyase superfamily protein
MVDYSDKTMLFQRVQAGKVRLGVPVNRPGASTRLQSIIGSPEGVVPGVASDVVFSREPVAIWQKTGSATVFTTDGWILVAGGDTTPEELFYTNLVTDYGADPTGAVPASAQLNAAIADASAAGSNVNNVYIPPGTYRMDATIRHQANVHVFGVGANTILRFDTGINAWDFDPGFLRAELSNLVILGVFGAPAPVGLNLDQSQRCFIHDMQIWDFQIDCLLSSGASFSAYNVIGPNVELNRSTVVGLRALANANGNLVVSTRIFFTYNSTSTAIGVEAQDIDGLELDHVQIEAADVCIRSRNTSGIFHLNVHDTYLEPGTNPNTLVVGSAYDIVIDSLFDGIETLYIKNVTVNASRGGIDVPPEMFADIDGYSRAFFGARFSGAAVPKRNYTYNGQVLYYGLPSVLPGWGVSGVPPTLSPDPLHVTGNRSLRAQANAANSNVACGFTVSDEGVEWITCGIRYQILAGNVGFTFTGTCGANNRQYVPEPTPTNTWRESYVTVPVDPTNRSGALGCVVDAVNGTGSILIDEIWAVPGKFAIPSTQYGERIQFLPAPIPILTRTGVVGNETFGPIDLLTLPATLAPPLDLYSTAPAGVVGAVLRMFLNCTGAPAGLIAAFHQIYIDVVASGAIVPASFEFLQAVYSGQFHTKDIIKRGTTVSGGYNAADGFASDYNIALIAWVLG